MKTFALRKNKQKQNSCATAQTGHHPCHSMSIYSICSLVFLSFYCAKICLKFLCLFIYSFSVVSISDYGIFIDRLSKLENIVSLSDRRTWHVPLNL